MQTWEPDSISSGGISMSTVCILVLIAAAAGSRAWITSAVYLYNYAAALSGGAPPWHTGLTLKNSRPAAVIITI